MTKAFKQDLELEFEQIRNLPLNIVPSTTLRSENAEDVALKDLKQTSIATTDPRRQMDVVCMKRIKLSRYNRRSRMDYSQGRRR
jgi:hypothetical protein